MNRVFLDTVGLLARWDSSDQWFVAARDAQVALALEGVEYITTCYVLAECANAAARRPYRDQPAGLRVHLERGGGLVFSSIEDWNAAWAAYTRGEAGDAGLVDQLSFAVMRRLGIRQAFTNDRHLRLLDLRRFSSPCVLPPSF